MRTFDWAQHPLGDPTRWPQNLRTLVRIILTSRHAMFIWWGETLLNLYNDAYIPVLGVKHPDALARPASAVWHEIWDVIGLRAEHALSTGEGTYEEALLLIMERKGFPEETYFTFSYSPIADDQGANIGIFCPATDETERIIGERQVALLRELSARTADARTWQDACVLAAEGLATDPYDIPWALLYLLDSEHNCARLAAASGIDAGSVLAPAEVNLLGDCIWPLADAAQTRRTLLVAGLAEQAAGLHLPPGPYGWPATQAVVLPITASGGTGKMGLLVAGLNPLRLYDDSYERFLQLVAGQIAAAIANGDAYAQERRRAEALAELDRAKTTFFSNISHELRTPLALILGPLEEMMAAEQDSALRRQLEMVQRNSLRLLKLVNTLLDFARIEASRIQALYEPTDLAAATADLASTFRSAIEKAGLHLHVDCPPLPQPVFVDGEMWEKIVLNLLSNAFKYTFSGEIVVALHQLGDAVVLTVRDTGIGIPPEQLPHIFDRFHRVPNARGRTLEGSGIGLALVKELVRLHGGAIEAASIVGEGTTITITLPMGSAHLPAASVSPVRRRISTALGARPFVEEALRWLPGDAEPETLPLVSSMLEQTPATDAGPATPTPGARQRILVVDDNADMRQYLQQLLSRRWSVTTAGDGAAALAAVQNDPPDLVLTDLMMPELDGYALLAQLRADERLRSLPVILLSARAGDEARSEGMEAGADDYLVKPFSTRELMARIQAHLELAHVRNEAAAVQRALAAELEQQVRRFEAITSAAEDFIYTFDPQGRITYANKVLHDLWRRTPEDAYGKDLWELGYPAEEAARLTEQVKQVISTRQPLRDETILLDFAEGGASYEYIFTPIIDSSGEAVGVAGISRDTTQRRRFEEQLRASEQALRGLSQSLEARVQERTVELQRSNKELDQFAYIASHDLKAPLRAIDNLAGWIAEDAAALLPPQSQEHFAKLKSRVRRMEKLLDDLLAYSRAGRHLHQPEWVDTEELVRDVTSLLAPPSGFVLDVPAPLPKVFSERVPLETVLRNLIGNAIKHHEQPHAASVTISAQGEDGWIEFTIQDNGPGIEPQHHDRIFQVFQTLKPRDQVEGSGMGLAVVKKIIESRGGRIQVISQPGQGAAFCFTWPQAKDDGMTG